MDTVSNGGFLQFSAGGILSPLPGDLARDYGPCDYDIRHNLNAQYVYQLPVRVRNHSLGYALNGWQISGTMFWHSGVPFSVLSTPYSAINQSTGQGEGIVQGAGRSSPVSFPAFRFMSITPFRVYRRRERSSGSIRTHLYRRSIRAQGNAMAATTHRIANSETSAVMPCAVPISSGVTST